MRQLQLIAHGEPSDVIELNTVSEPALGQDDVLISMEASPINPSDFLFVRGMYGVRPAFPSSVGAEGVGRVGKIGSKVDVALRSKRVLIPDLRAGHLGRPSCRPSAQSRADE
jgi:NADPH:quinone reductase-like Zn-dependent oxidoreductase